MPLVLTILLLQGAVMAEPSSELRRTGFAIYCVSEEQSEARSRIIGIDELPLEGTPYLTEDQITSYDWSTHTLHLIPGVLEKQPWGRIFVVTVGELRIYRGFFTHLLSSTGYIGEPVIYDPHMPTADGSSVPWWLPGKENTISISLWGGVRYGDPRFDKRLYDHLKAVGLLADEE